MQGKPVVIEQLNKVLSGDLTAIDMYLLQAARFRDWGYSTLAQQFEHESNHEKEHSQRLIDRILFLEGKPDLSSRIGFVDEENIVEIFKQDLLYEKTMAENIRHAIEICWKESDHGTRHLFESLLEETEGDHILFLEKQLHLIQTLGLKNYLSENLNK